MASSDAPIDVGHVALVVRDLETVAAYYRDVIGLKDLGGDRSSRRLGAGGRMLLELRHDGAARQRDPRAAGLFHTAFLLPSRQALANWLGHIARIRAPLQGASDHRVSEAIYLADPEGNGIEVYSDRPRDSWERAGNSVTMSTDALDLYALLDTAQAHWAGMPDDSVVGHVHLQVGSIPEAEDFYGRVLGLDLTARYPGGSFFASGGLSPPPGHECLEQPRRGEAQGWRDRARRSGPACDARRTRRHCPARRYGGTSDRSLEHCSNNRAQGGH